MWCTSQQLLEELLRTYSRVGLHQPCLGVLFWIFGSSGNRLSTWLLQASCSIGACPHSSLAQASVPALTAQPILRAIQSALHCTAAGRSLLNMFMRACAGLATAPAQLPSEQSPHGPAPTFSIPTWTSTCPSWLAWGMCCPQTWPMLCWASTRSRTQVGSKLCWKPCSVPSLAGTGYALIDLACAMPGLIQQQGIGELVSSPRC